MHGLPQYPWILVNVRTYSSRKRKCEDRRLILPPAHSASPLPITVYFFFAFGVGGFRGFSRYSRRFGRESRDLSSELFAFFFCETHLRPNRMNLSPAGATVTQIPSEIEVLALGAALQHEIPSVAREKCRFFFNA